MSDSSENFQFDGFKELFDNSLTNKISAAVTASLFLLLVVNAVDVMGNNDGVRSVLDGNNNWQITFEEIIVTQTDTVVVADGDTETRTFTIDETLLDEGYRIGSFRMTITYGETSGIPGDPVDSVFTTIPQSDMNAQWSDENNTLSDSSSDGSDIDLMLRAYPDYDGQMRNVTGYNEIQVLENWNMDGYGIGEIQIEISVETQSLPLIADNEEEVTITLEIITFKPVAQQ
ncbi:MAG: hypothetical protein NZ736_02670 [Candidatus Poseidoniaceae archaeon]|nr:hypothetical protein [Candidatus Poseidoniaceae archaeon]